MSAIAPRGVDDRLTGLNALAGLTGVSADGGRPAGRSFGNYRGLRISSAFQPVFSIAHSQPVGYEALARAVDQAGQVVSPGQLFSSAQTRDEIVDLDRLCRRVHTSNFAAQATAQHWLLLNMHPYAFSDPARYSTFLPELLARLGLPPHRVVIEVLESALYRNTDMGDPIEEIRKLGCLVAIDDFGAGHSNFDRVLRMRPNIVKLDRSLIRQASLERTARIFMSRITSMLHEANCLVLAEGVETAAEAITALDADVDLMQGFYFCRPTESIADCAVEERIFDALYLQSQRLFQVERKTYEAEISPYRDALAQAAERMRSGLSMQEACAGFLDLPLAERCYLLSDTGAQIGQALLAAHTRSHRDPRFRPVSEGSRLNWSHRYYFRRAVATPGRVNVTRPYLSLPTGMQCTTASIAFSRHAETLILCGDLQWEQGGVAN